VQKVPIISRSSAMRRLSTRRRRAASTGQRPGRRSPVDRFALATDVPASPEQRARAMFGDVPSAHRRLVPRVLRDAEARIRRGGVR
jgi:hypothetical protein